MFASPDLAARFSYQVQPNVIFVGIRPVRLNASRTAAAGDPGAIFVAAGMHPPSKLSCAAILRGGDAETTSRLNGFLPLIIARPAGILPPETIIHDTVTPMRPSP
jgi:hypothetical protein